MKKNEYSDLRKKGEEYGKDIRSWYIGFLVISLILAIIVIVYLFM